MKILILTLSVYFSIFEACNIYAGNTTLTTNYPAPTGSYTSIVIQTQSAIGSQPGTNVQCTNSNNAGLLFVYTDPVSGNQSLETCAQGFASPIPYPETCFSRFSNSPGTFYGCPNGYVMATDSTLPNAIVANGDVVYTTVCCSAPYINGASTSSTVTPP